MNPTVLATTIAAMMAANSLPQLRAPAAQGDAGAAKTGSTAGATAVPLHPTKPTRTRVAA